MSIVLPKCDEAFGWRRCSHDGIGKPGCSTCDPLPEHRRLRREWLLEHGELFGCCGNEDELSCSSPAEAIKELLEEGYERDETLDVHVRRLAPIRVTVYRREEVTLEWRDSAAARLADELAAHFADSYGSPEESPEDPSAAVLDLLACAVNLHASKAFVWRCEEMGTVELSADEAMALLGEAPAAIALKDGAP